MGIDISQDLSFHTGCIGLSSLSLGMVGPLWWVLLHLVWALLLDLGEVFLGLPAAVVSGLLAASPLTTGIGSFLVSAGSLHFGACSSHENCNSCSCHSWVWVFGPGRAADLEQDNLVGDDELDQMVVLGRSSPGGCGCVLSNGAQPFNVLISYVREGTKQ